MVAKLDIIEKNLQKQDLKVNWHPCMQMKDFATTPPLTIKFAKNEFLFDYQGNSYIDATSSWWCKNLGHSQPSLQQALVRQLQKFEHVIYANTTNSTIVELSTKLIELMPHCQRVTYASDGSSAVEIAVKMSLHANQILNNKRVKIASLAGGYHGETIFTLALSDCALYSKPFKHLLPEVNLIADVPLVTDKNDSLWDDASDAWQKAMCQLEPLANDLSCIILEPIVQGAGGMRIYSPDFLKRLAAWAKQNHIHLIADEIMTGFARTGKMFAYQHANVQPDFICLGKGLTAGMLPMSAVVTTEEIYNVFYDDYATGKAFLHSHTHSGNALTAAVAVEVINLMSSLNVVKSAKDLEVVLLQNMQQVASETKMIENIRCVGGIVAADLIDNENRKAHEVCLIARKYGVLMRPLANTLYWLPPLTISNASLEVLKLATIKSLLSL